MALLSQTREFTPHGHDAKFGNSEWWGTFSEPVFDALSYAIAGRIGVVKLAAEVYRRDLSDEV